MIIDLSQIPDGGMVVRGTYSEDILDLDARGSASADPERPVWYDLKVECFGGELVLTGEIGAGVTLVCARCTAEFTDELRISDYCLEVPIESEVSMDLTERIREDILLVLPWYPHCAESSIEDRQCTGVDALSEAANESNLSADKPGEDDGAGGSGVWGALDGLSDPKK